MKTIFTKKNLPGGRNPKFVLHPLRLQILVSYLHFLQTLDNYLLLPAFIYTLFSVFLDSGCYDHFICELQKALDDAEKKRWIP